LLSPAQTCLTCEVALDEVLGLLGSEAQQHVHLGGVPAVQANRVAGFRLDICAWMHTQETAKAKHIIQCITWKGRKSYPPALVQDITTCDWSGRHMIRADMGNTPTTHP
jgi:hypothetical protein